MTERLYYTDSYQQDFIATVIAISEVDGRATIQLDRTGFYPTSGGQPFDTGSIESLIVRDVFVDQENEIQHVVDLAVTDGILPQVGATVRGAVDWPRRYDHMQQHSGQHLLSQVFFEEYGIETVAVHFGAVESTLDLAIEALSLEQLDRVEERANAQIYAALPIRAYFVNEEQLAAIPLRRPPKVTGTIRIVEIDQYDYSACGGTHVGTTAEIGSVKITKTERRRGQLRVTFLCGWRSYRDYVEKHRLLVEAAALFSNEINQVPTLITRTLALLKEKERALVEAQEHLLNYEAADLLASALLVNGVRIVQHHLQAGTANQLKTLANQLQNYDNVVGLLAATGEEKVTLGFVCNQQLSRARQLDMGQLLRKLLQPLNGKGGGKADFAQGGGIEPGAIAAVFAAAVHELQKLLEH